MAEVKFCGMTREEDVLEAARLGARYVGMIMTNSPRRILPERAAQLCSELHGTGVRTVGVFGNEPVDAILLAASLSGVAIIQLHGRTLQRNESGEAPADPHPADLNRIRVELGVDVWRVVRVGADGLGEPDRSSVEGADGILLDTMVPGGPPGGTGVVFDWERVSAEVQALREGRRLIVAGGLRPGNVRLAIDRLAPDVVDVSSGVESAPGVKDHHLMTAFMASVNSTTASTQR